MSTFSDVEQLDDEGDVYVIQRPRLPKIIVIPDGVSPGTCRNLVGRLTEGEIENVCCIFVKKRILRFSAFAHKFELFSETNFLFAFK